MRLYSNTISNRLFAQLSQYPEKEMLFDYRGRTLSAGKIIEGIDLVAIDLIRAGLKKGERVLFLARPSIEFIIYFFAIHRVGCSVVLVDPEMGQENFMSRIKFSKATWMVQDKALEQIERYSFIKPILSIFGVWLPKQLPFTNKKRITVKRLVEIFKLKKADNIREETIPDGEEMTVIFTSGTADSPKGVIHSYASMAAAIDIIISEIPITKSDLLYASQFYFLLIALAVSAQAFIPKNKSFNPEHFFTTVLKLRVTSAFLLPYEGELIYKFCKKEKNLIPSSFRTILFGSAPVTKGFLTRFSAICPPSVKVYDVYGSTEMLAISSVEMREKINYSGEGDLLGKPAKTVKVTISNDKEILASGPQLFVKYLGDTENAKVFHSGDLGTIDSQGNIVLFGRKKDMIIRKGYNVYPALFETGISKIPGVTECSMVGVYDNDQEDEKIILFVMSDMTDASFLGHLREALKSGPHSIDKYAYPDEIIFVKEMPRSGRSRKIDKRALQDIARKKL